MKLLAINSYYKPAYIYGGPVRSEASLFEGLSRLGVEVIVITTDANGDEKLNMPLLTPVDIDGVKVIYCPTCKMLGTRFYSKTQIKIAQQYIPYADIVNLQTFWGWATRPLSNACVKSKIPYFVSLRGQLMEYAMQNVGLVKRFKKKIFLHSVGYNYLNKAAALHCTSLLEISQVKAYPITSPMFLVSNGIDTNKYTLLPKRGLFRQRYQISDDALVMVMIGRLDAVKKPEIAVSTLIAAQKLCFPVHLLIIGPDEKRMVPILRRQANNAGCENRLHFTGLLQKDAILQAMADSDLFIMPSASENFGMSAAESMAAGLPILVSDKVPVGALAKQFSSGTVVPCEEEAFSEAALSLLSSPDKLKEMGQKGKEAARDLFDNDVVARTMLINLERIISTSKYSKDDK